MVRTSVKAAAAAAVLVYCVALTVHHRIQAARLADLQQSLELLAAPSTPPCPPCGHTQCSAGSADAMEAIEPLIRLNIDPLPDRSFSLSGEEMCEREGSSACLAAWPTRHNFTSMVRVSSRNKLMSCYNHKSMSTIMTAVMCYLSDPKKFRDGGRHFKDELDGGSCKTNSHRYVSDFEKRDVVAGDDSSWRYAFVTREPVDRFLSGFIDRCIRTPMPPYCNGCHQNMTCFIVSEYERFASQIEKESYPETFEDVHFWPQHWACDLEHKLNMYDLIRYSSDPTKELLTDLTQVLLKQNVSSEEVSFISRELTVGRTIHSTVQTNARKFLENRLRSSPFLLEYIVRMFYYDFKLFNYDLPQGF